MYPTPLTYCHCRKFEMLISWKVRTNAKYTSTGINIGRDIVCYILSTTNIDRDDHVLCLTAL